MKKNISLVAFLFLFPLMGILVSSCKEKDSDIQAAIETAKKDFPGVASVMVSVNDGVATLTGECKDDASKSSFEAAVGKVKGVKQVINNCTIEAPPPPPPAPVVISPDDALTKMVTDAIKDYPGVTAAVKDGEITLTGTIKRANLQKLMIALNGLKPKKINNQLTINK